MTAIRVTFTEREIEERRILRDAFARRVPVEFRGKRVHVVGEFKHGPNGESAPYVYVLQLHEEAPAASGSTGDGMEPADPARR
jgi:hypothetical protein